MGSTVTLVGGQVELRMPEQSARASHCHFCQLAISMNTGDQSVKATLISTAPAKDVDGSEVDDRSCGVWTTGAEGAGQVTQIRQAVSGSGAGGVLWLQLQASYT